MKQLTKVDYRTFYKTNEFVAHTTPMRFHYFSKNKIERWIWTKKKIYLKDMLAHIDYHKILDVGCGDGGLYELINQNAYYTGVDISPTQLASFRKSLRKAEKKDKKKGHVTLIQSDISKLPLGDHKFDVVLACDVLEHVLEPHRVLKEIKRVVRPGGYIIFSVPNEPLLQLSRLVTLRFPLRSPDHLYAIALKDIYEFFPKTVEIRGIPFNLLPSLNLLNILLTRNSS